MRILLQRVREARVEIGGLRVAAIGRGLLLLIGFTDGDDRATVDRAVAKVTRVRVFADDRGRLARSLLDTGGGLLAVPQFTLYGDVRRGLRPDFGAAMDPAAARGLFDTAVESFARVVPEVGSGVFGAEMQVALVNDGPVTLMLEFR